MTGQLARSLSGHDKDQIYVIIRQDERYVYLADGVYKTTSHPKKKNVRHIQIIKQIPSEVTDLLYGEEFLDLNIKRAIKLYEIRKDA